MLFTDPVVLLCLFILSVILILWMKIGWERTLKNFPPGPYPLPLIGNLHLLDLKRPSKTLIELSKTYGPVFSFQMGVRKAVVLSGYQTVKDALVNNADEFAERNNMHIFKINSNEKGVIFSHGENWKVMRRFTLSTLRDFGMGKRTIADKIIEESAYLIDCFKSHKGKPFDNQTITNAAVCNIIVSITIGHRYQYDDSKFLRLISLINENVRLAGSPTVTLFNLYPVLGFLPGNHKTMIQNMNELHAFIQKTFVEHLKELDKNDQRSLIDAFLVKQQEEKSNPHSYFNDENLTNVVSNLFVAGTETTSTTLRWGLLLMMKYPEIQRKVQEEIAKVIGSAQPCTEHRRQMPYTDAVIHEIQRFANILPLNLPHETTVDVNFKGHFIPKGTQVITLLESVLYDKSQFEKPEEFYPQHFLDSEGKFQKKEAFMPFSAGRRVCLGETLAKMELFLFFTRLLQEFSFHLPPGVTHVDLTPAVAFTVCPLPHMICAVQR
ncbi:cytochrome P450 2K6 [Microcaecilia unicolor]|uniref:Cytochrome P450 2K6-like n=1 Tax=Microcaecilia unicolor TaxID=1415580 RepID=A0A6P7XNA8_9AMPH|nr:cytochrome P450 2K6-like [Microcaecilia unicolor]